MAFPLPRILYSIAALCWILLLWQNPITIFLAACLSCLTLPIYRRLRNRAIKWRKNLEKPEKISRLRRVLLKLTQWFPVTAYTTFLLCCFLAPLGALIVLVSPQAMAGLAKLRELQAVNFRLPPHLLEYIDHFRRWLSNYPTIEKTINDGLANMDSLFTNFISMLVSQSFGFVGSTMNVLWLIFLFFTLSVLFTVHCRLLRKISCRILHIPSRMLGRFIFAIYRALRALILGIALVALIQGALCGLGFAVAGVNQPAFWALLATFVAPIPMVGTALVWVPLCVSLWFSGSVMAAILLALWGGIFVSGADSVLRPFFLRQGIDASFFVLILSILCGLSAFGSIGLIAGPVLLAVAVQASEEASRYYQATH